MKNKILIVIAVIVLLILLIVGFVFLHQPKDDNTDVNSDTNTESVSDVVIPNIDNSNTENNDSKPNVAEPEVNEDIEITTDDKSLLVEGFNSNKGNSNEDRGDKASSGLQPIG